jgi:hypothetical protein
MELHRRRPNPYILNYFLRKYIFSRKKYHISRGEYFSLNFSCNLF